MNAGMRLFLFKEPKVVKQSTERHSDFFRISYTAFFRGGRANKQKSLGKPRVFRERESNLESETYDIAKYLHLHFDNNVWKM